MFPTTSFCQNSGQAFQFLNIYLLLVLQCQTTLLVQIVLSLCVQVDLLWSWITNGMEPKFGIRQPDSCFTKARHSQPCSIDQTQQSKAEITSRPGKQLQQQQSDPSSQASTCPTPEQQPIQKIAVAVQVPFFMQAQAGLLDTQERLQDGMLQRAQLHICLNQWIPHIVELNYMHSSAHECTWIHLYEFMAQPSHLLYELRRPMNSYCRWEPVRANLEALLFRERRTKSNFLSVLGLWIDQIDSYINKYWISAQRQDRLKLGYTLAAVNLLDQWAIASMSGASYPGLRVADADARRPGEGQLSEPTRISEADD